LTRTRNRKLTIRQRKKLRKLELRQRKMLRNPNSNLKPSVTSKKLLKLLKRMQRCLWKNYTKTLTKTNLNLNLNSLMTVLGHGRFMQVLD
jgi:hypothetical protein